MKNKKIKLLPIVIVTLLFLVSWVNQVRAADYYQNSVKVTKTLNDYCLKPAADLVTLTAHNLIYPFKNYYLSEKLIRTALNDFSHFGTKYSNYVGRFLTGTANVLAIVPDNLPNISQISAATAKTLSKTMPAFKNWGKVFEISGEALAKIPNNLPKAGLAANNFFIGIKTKTQESVVITAAFFGETFNNLTNNPPKEFYPKTQQLITGAKDNLENRFNQTVGVAGLER